MTLIQTFYAWIMAAVDNGGGDQSISLITVLVVLAIIALIVFIFSRWRGR